MPDLARSDAVSSAVASANAKYKTKLTYLFSGGLIFYPLGYVDSLSLIGGSTQDLFYWKVTKEAVAAAHAHVYQSIALYDHKRFVGSPAPSLDLSIPRNKYIYDLVLAFRQQHGYQTLYYHEQGDQFGYTFEQGSGPGLHLVPYELKARTATAPSNQTLAQALAYQPDTLAKQFNQQLAFYDNSPPMVSLGSGMQGSAASSTTPIRTPAPSQQQFIAPQQVGGQGVSQTQLSSPTSAAQPLEDPTGSFDSASQSNAEALLASTSPALSGSRAFELEDASIDAGRVLSSASMAGGFLMGEAFVGITGSANDTGATMLANIPIEQLGQ